MAAFKGSCTALSLTLMAALAMSFAPAPSYAFTCTVVSGDGAGEGLNDTTPAAPVGGNSGTTKGAQRKNVIQAACDFWGAMLQSSVPVTVTGLWDPLFCAMSGAFGAVAGPRTFSANFTGAPLPETWYPGALANSLAGVDLDPGNRDLAATGNSSLDAGCLPGVSFYYGLDHNNPVNSIDAFEIFKHEIAHGLGFTSTVDDSTGAKLAGRDDSYMIHLEDHSTGIAWSNMTNAARQASAIDAGDLHWTGSFAVNGGRVLTAGRHSTTGHIRMYAPSSLSGSSVSHLDTTLSPNELMEPDYTAGATIHTVSHGVLEDLGWRMIAAAPTCAVTPLSGCRVAARSSFSFRQNSDSTKDRFTWTWTKGSLVDYTELGDPTATAAYRLCVYVDDSPVMTASLPGGGVCPSGACWSTKPEKSYQYKDKLGSRYGITGMSVTAGIEERSKARLKGKGSSLPNIALPITGSLTVQLLNLSNNLCLTSDYLPEEVTQDPSKGKLRAKY